MKRHIAVVTLLFVVACTDSSTGPTYVSSGPPSKAILDARHGGNPHFFWLNPQTNLSAFDKSFTGTLNQNMSPVVRICRWSGTACIGDDVAVLHRADESIKDKIYWYEALWQAWAAQPQLNELFRARVFLGNLEIGVRDIKFVTRAQFNSISLDNVEFAPVFWDPRTYGTSFPNGKYVFRFRLEDGVLREALGLGDEECTDCAEGSVPAGSTETVVIETPSDDAAAVFEPGSVPQDINVLVEKLDVPCLPTDAQQYPACYRFVAEPDIEFTIPATVEVCIEEIDDFADGQVQLYKVKERRVEGEWVPTGPVEPLENVADRFINCGEPEIIGVIARKYPKLARGLRTLTRPLAKVIAPRAAYAEDEGRGGRAGEFSRIGWARAVNIAKGSGDNQSGVLGGALSPVVVHLTPVHYDDHGEGAPAAAGVPVAFRLIGPDDVAGPVITATSNSDGAVSIPVTLGSAAGTYRLVVTAPGTNLADRNPETGDLTSRPVPQVTFTATAVSPVITNMRGDADNFGFGVGNATPCIFYDRSDPVADLGIFDRELFTTGDHVESWTHDFTAQIPSGFTATDVLIEIPEFYSDFTASTITIDGTTYDFTANGVSRCVAPIVQTFRFTGAAAAFANDGVINIQFNENGDDVVLDYSRVTVSGSGGGIILGRMAGTVAAPRALSAREITAARATVPKTDGYPRRSASVNRQQVRTKANPIK